MNRWTILFLLIVMGAFAAIGCSGGGDDPVTPDTQKLALTSDGIPSGQTQTLLWGYYDIYFDFENQTVEAVANRNAMFTVNVVNFVNDPTTNLGFDIHGTKVGTDYIDVDIDVSIAHPFPGMTHYNGYDVRGGFMGEGSGEMAYNADLDYPVFGTDQVMYDYDDIDEDPYAEPVGMPDGYTRWFNAGEFPVSCLFGYIQGALATPDYSDQLTSTLNPYKYYANGLGVEDDLWDFLVTTGDNAVFISGTTNTRNYYLRFPTPEPNVKYGYAILADWYNVDVHPSNAAEAVACNATVTDNVWYQDALNNGGNLILDIDLFDWNSQVNLSGVMEDYTIFIESNVLSAVYPFDATDMTPGSGGDIYSTYHVEIPATNVTFNSSTADGEFWVIVEDSTLDYSNNFGVINDAWDDPLAAFFRGTFFISGSSYNVPPEITSGVDGDETPYYQGVEVYSVTATDNDGDPLTYDWTVTDVAVPAEVTTGVTDNLDGTIDIDFAVVGANLDDEYLIECDVTDNINSPVAATPLTVIASLPGFIVVGDPNIDILIGSDPPLEIAVDPGSDRVAIGYEWTSWRVFTDDYTTPSSLYAVLASRPLKHFDFDNTYGYRSAIVDNGKPNGGGYMHWNGAPDSVTNYTNLFGYFDWCNVANTTQMRGLFYRSNDDGNYRYITSLGHLTNIQLDNLTWWGADSTNGIVPDNVVALDVPVGPVGQCLYILEGLPATNTAVVELHNFSFNNASYGGIKFGEGTLYAPLDITVDSDDYVYILDVNDTGDPVLYAYDNTGTLIAESGPISTDDISGTPKRMDAAIFPDPDEVHVLHTDGVTKFTIDW